MRERGPASSVGAFRDVTSPRMTPEPAIAAPRRWGGSGLTSLLGRADLPRLGELAALRPATRVLIAGFSGWIVLVVLVTVAAIAAMELSATRLPEWLRGVSSADRSAAARPPASLENIVQRPLFARSRQGVAQMAAPVAAAVPVPSTLDQDITLKGVFMSGSIAKAFVLSSQTPLGMWVQADDEIAGWKVISVHPDQMLLAGQGDRRSVPLSVGAAK